MVSCTGLDPVFALEGPGSGLERDAGDQFTPGIWILLDETFIADRVDEVIDLKD